MLDSVSLFTKELFDYAGLFPPAKLPLVQAFQNFTHYQTHVQNNALGKFIFPLEKTDEFISFRIKLQNATIPFSVLLTKVQHSSLATNSLALDIQKLEQLAATTPCVCISSFETVPPEDILTSSDKGLLFSYFKTLQKFLAPFKTTVFFEVPYENSPSEFFLRTLGEHIIDTKTPFAAKLRTGGTHAHQIPSAESLARIILQCAQNRLPVKLTAGLHVPVPNFNPSVGATLHGFLNVVCCLLVAHDHFCGSQNSPVTQSSLQNILTNFKEDDFKFTADGLHIGSVFMANDRLKKLRDNCVKSIGTCSFLEPLEHLSHMGVL